jgi:hypothetical protein
VEKTMLHLVRGNEPNGDVSREDVSRNLNYNQMFLSKISASLGFIPKGQRTKTTEWSKLSKVSQQGALKSNWPYSVELQEDCRTKERPNTTGTN